MRRRQNERDGRQKTMKETSLRKEA